jgi:hypothetical protein
MTVSPESRACNSCETFADFIQDLFIPLKKRMALHWASTFGNVFNGGMAVYASGAVEALQNFHKNILDCAELDCSNLAHLGLLNAQLDARVQSIRQALGKFKVNIKRKQREGNRLFVKLIAAYMEDIYKRCSSLHGASSHFLSHSSFYQFSFSSVSSHHPLRLDTS